ncbi:MAG: TldD/PmbA family protein [bacterium]
MTILNTTALLESILEKARKKGADHAAAVLMEDNVGAIRFAANRITQHKTHQNTSLTLAVAVEGKESVIQTNLLQNDNLDELVNKAILFAQNAPINPEFFEPVSPQKYENTNAWFESTAQLDIDSRADIVKTICDLGEAGDVNIYGNLYVTEKSKAVANTKGLFAEQPSTEISISLSTRTRRHDGSSQAHLWEGDWNRFHYLDTVERSIRIAKQSAEPRYQEPGTYTVILSPKALSEYLMFLLFAMDAREADKGHSFFGKSSNNSRLGDKCFKDSISIKSVVNHPELPTLKFGNAGGSGGSYAGNFFSMGLPMKTIEWIKEGAIQNFQHSPYYARIKNIDPIAYPKNLFMPGGTFSVEDLVTGVNKGLLIESFWYVNPIDWNRLELTGLTRDGVFWIENGEIRYPVNNFRFNDSPINSLNRITGMTPAIKTYGEYWPGLFPWVRIDGFHLSSVSHAV